MVVGAAGNVGAYAVQMAVDAGIHVVAIAHLDDEDLLRSLGVKSIIDSSKPAFEQDLPQVDAILDTVGGSTFQRCVAALKPGGKLVTSVSTQPLPAGAVFFYAEVTTARLQTLTPLFDAGRITARVGSILPLSEARQAQAHACGRTTQARQDRPRDRAPAAVPVCAKGCRIASTVTHSSNRLSASPPKVTRRSDFKNSIDRLASSHIWRISSLRSVSPGKEVPGNTGPRSSGDPLATVLRRGRRKRLRW